MKRNLSIIAILVTGLTSSLSMAADSGSIAVTANVTGKCKFETVGALNFATPIAVSSIDPSETSPATGSASVTYRCTSGTPATGVSFPTTSGNYLGGHRVRIPATANYMAYTVASSGFTSTGAGFGGAVITGTVTGTILQSVHQGAVAGAYTDSLPITITP